MLIQDVLSASITKLNKSSVKSKISKQLKISSDNNCKIKNDSKIRQIIQLLCFHKIALKQYEFLLLLSDNYYTKKYHIFPSKKYYINKLKLPGKVTIEKYSDLLYQDTNKYLFESNPIPNEIYIKLQKENIYIPYSDFEQKLLESKFNEFYDVLTTIGAKYIKTSKIINNSHNNDLNIGTDIGLNSSGCENAKISNKVQIKNENNTSLFLTQEMEFNHDKDPILEHLLTNNYYYLPYQLDLQNLIIRRIENNQVKDKYIYVHKQNNLLNTKLLSKFQKFNIGINFELHKTIKQISNFQIEYEIDFFDIKNKDINVHSNNYYKCNSSPSDSPRSNTESTNNDTDNYSQDSNKQNIIIHVDETTYCYNIDICKSFKDCLTCKNLN